MDTRRTPAHSLATRLERDLGLIRETMLRATAFRGIAGSAWMLMGGIGLAGATLARTAPSPGAWLTVWLTTAVLAAAVGGVATGRHAAREGFRLTSPPARRFWALMLTPLAGAAVLTAVFVVQERWELLPGTWLLLYGLGLQSGGSLCRPTVRRSGLAFQALGLLAFAWPGAGEALLAIGFAGIHAVAGAWMLGHAE